jgi:hypothetical protein
MGGIAGCSHFSTKKYSQYSEGTWQGKALIRDKVRSKSAIANLKIKAVDGQKVRIDLVSPVGAHLGSLLLVGDRFEYLNVQDKTYQSGQATRDSLASLLYIPLHPSAFYNLLFEKPMADKNWSCTSNEKGFLVSCKDLKAKLDIEWKGREGEKRTIGIDHAKGSVQLNLYDFEAGVSDPDKAFQLTVPESFRRLPI